MTIVSPDIKVVNDGGLMNDRFSAWVEDVSRLSPLVGNGDPEGVVGALRGRFYIDLDGLAGSVLYVKRDSNDISGDRKKGWILV